MPRQSHAVRSLVALACAFGALVVPAHALAAEDLVVLDGDPAPLLQGNLTFARAYVNSTLRLTGNTSLNVDSLYIGPRAQIQSCWVPDPANPAENGDPAGCTNGRTLVIRSRGGVQIAPAISLEGGSGPARAGGALVITGTTITLGGAISTQGLGGRPSGPVTLVTGGALRFQSINAPGATVNVSGARGVSAAGGIDARPYNGGPHSAGRAAYGGAVAVTSSAGNVVVRDGVLVDGADAGGPGLYGGNGGRATIVGGDVNVATVRADGGSSQNVMGGIGGLVRISARGRATLGATSADGGDAGAQGRGGNGNTVQVVAGRKTIVDSATARGGGGGRSGGAGGAVRVRGSSLVVSNLSASGANGNGAALNPPGGRGGQVEVIGSGRVLVPGIGASGGNGAGTGGGAVGGVVVVQGSRIVVQGGITVSGGDANGGRGGPAGAIAVTTTAGSLRVIGGLDASGATSTANVAGAAGRVTVNARGPALIVGQVSVQGANGGLGGSAGGRATLRAPSFQLLSGFGATGGNGTQAGRAGGHGAIVDVATGGALSMGSLSVAGGNGTGAGPGGGGGAALVSAAALQLSGGITVTGGSSPNGNAGVTGAMSLRASGPVSIAGTLDASGTNAANGVASAGGRVALTVGGDGYVGAVDVSGGDGRSGGRAAGAAMLRGASLDVGSVASAGGSGVTNASGGHGGTVDIVTRGDFTTFAGLSPVGGNGAGSGSGGPGGIVSVVADDVSVGGVDVTGGNPGNGAGGATGRIRMIAYSDMNVLGGVDASGSGAGGTAPASDAGSIYLRAGSTLTTGTISVSGANGGTRGSRGARLDLLAHDATIDAIFGDGGTGTGAGNPPGGVAGLMVARLTGRLDVGVLSFRGGTGNHRGAPGAGGAIDVTAHDIDAEAALTTGGFGFGRGGFGGPIRLDADNDLTVVGQVQTDGATGSNAPGTGPGAPGGNAGRVLLRAGDGTLTLGAGVTAFGGRGGDPGGGFIPGAPGGGGGVVNVIARHIGALEAIETNGGDGSGPQDNAGPGGPGGTVRVWSDDGVLDGSRFVATSGGNGLPGGLEGAQTAEQSPADVTPSKKSISFTLRSPDASRVGLFAVSGPQAGLLVSASGVAGPLKQPKPVPCVAVRYAVVGVAPAMGWTSNPGGFVRGKAARNRNCRNAPKVSGAKKLTVSLAALAPGGYKLRVGARVGGLGIAKAEAMLGKASLASGLAPALRAGRVAITLQLPPALRRPGTYQIRLSSHALVGRKARTSTITLEVRP